MDLALTASLIMLGGVIIFLILGTPIAISVGIASFLAILVILPYNSALTTSSQRMFVGLDSFALLAIPFFILAGNLMNNGGIAIRLVNFAKIISGFFPAPLAQTNVVSNMLFGSISGSGVASCAAVGGVMTPVQKKEGYDPKYSAAVNIASSPTGMLIPPSNTLIVYATVAGSVSVSALFIGGYIPGILWGLGVMAVAGFIGKKRGYISKHSMSLKESIHITLQAIPSISLIVVVIGGILGGIFTATEASAIAVIYSITLGFAYKQLKLKDFPTIFLNTAKMSSIVIFMIGTSSIMSWVMAFTQFPALIANSIGLITENPILILLLINIILLFIGTFMDPTPAVLIFTPIFLPICTDLGMHPVHFGILMVFNLSLGTITPPVGPILFTGCKISNLKIDSVIKPLMPFFIVIFVLLLLVTYVPAISMTLPRLLGLIN